MRKEKILFAGDSITDSDHLWSGGRYGLGNGYVSLIQEAFILKQRTTKILNRGYNGYRCIDLLRRWDKLCLTENPDFVTILVGINEVGSAMEGMVEDVENFSMYYEELIKQTRNHTLAQIILMEPFLFVYPAYLLNWRENLEKIKKSIREIAKKYNLPLISLDEELNALAKEQGVDKISQDGIHLTDVGNSYLAKKWLEEFLILEKGNICEKRNFRKNA